MKIKFVHIYGYGKLINVQFPSFSSLQVIYGENEAGKSTLMAFIHGILFGFPTKQQSELRYEPKSHTQYGGRLTIETDEFGDVLIERISGKATGIVTVSMQDGTAGDEELLKKILRNVDKTMYQGIFSFNLHGLQGMGRVKGEDIGHYLLAAGTTGSDAIIKTEQQLQKEMDRLFKPNGRNPELNQMLQSLRDKEKELKKSKQHNQTYDQLQQERFSLEKEIHELQEKIASSQRRNHKLEQLMYEWPLYIERREILDRLNEIGEIQFPINGLSRLEKLEDQIRSITSQLRMMDERTKQLTNQLKLVSPNLQYDENHTQIQILIEKWPRVARWQEEIIKLQVELENWNEQIENVQRQIHFSENDMEQFSSVDLSIDMKERLRSTMREFFYLKSQELDLNNQNQREKNRLAAIEEQCEKVEAHLISEEEFRRLSDDRQNQHQLEQEQQQIIERIKLLESHNGNGSYVQTLMLYGLFIGISIWSMIYKQPVLTMAMTIGLIGLSISLWINRKKGKQVHRNERLKLENRAKVIREELNQYQDSKGFYLDQQRLRQEWKETIIQIEAQQIRYEETANQLLKWEQEWKKNKSELAHLKKQLMLKENFSSEKVSDAFDILCELSRFLKNRDSIRNQLTNLIQNQTLWQRKLAEQMNLLQIEGSPNEEGIIRLKNEWEKEQEKRRIALNVQKKLAEIQNEELKWKSESTSIQSEMDHLLVQASVQNQEEFRLKAKQYEEYVDLTSHLSIIEKKINIDDVIEVQSVATLNDLKQEQSDVIDAINSISSVVDTNHKKLAEVKFEIGVLEEGGHYTERLHEFYQLKSMFNDQARKWAKMALAKGILQKTMTRLKEERFPKVLHKAEEYLRFLTNEEYVQLHVRENGSFVVERKDQVQFEPEELSQATSEQVYVSLRLALVHVLKSDYPFPIIIDDGFVNFDENRTRKIIELLTEISKTTQVIFFTCHHHLLELFPRESIVNLMENEKYTLMN